MARSYHLYSINKSEITSHHCFLSPCKISFKYFLVKLQRRLQNYIFGGFDCKYFFYSFYYYGEVVGFCFLSPINNYRTPGLGGDGFELTFQIIPSHRDKGCGSSLIQVLQSFHENLYALVRQENDISNAVISKRSTHLGVLRKISGIFGSRYIFKA